jgi:hypothetical protein
LKRERPGHFGFAHGILVLVFLAPPALRLLLEEEREDARQAAAELDAEVASLRHGLERAREEIELLTGAPYAHGGAAGLPGRYQAVWADVLPLGDPSPARRALWIPAGGGGELPAPRFRTDCAVVHGKALVGRLVELPLGLGLARVQTLLDPLFRVRFRAGEVSGLLWGSGECDGDGWPLLEVRHLTAPEDLEPGARLFTSGGDGIYPAGLYLGEVLEEGAAGSRRVGPLVRAAVRPQSLQRVLVLIDPRRSFHPPR